jgi:dTDP-D-glucose 4,6-dehydratase
VKRNFSDTSKAMEKLKWKAEMPLEDGLKKNIKWFTD